MLKQYFWSSLERVSILVGSLIAFWFLALLAGPEEFAPIAVLSAILVVCSAVAEAGMYSALIRLPKINKNDYVIAFIFNLILGVVLTFLLIVFARDIAQFLDQPALTDTLPMIAPLCLVYAYGTCYKVELAKNFHLKSLVLSTFVASILALVVLLMCHYLLGYEPIFLAIIYNWVYAVVCNFIYSYRSQLKFAVDNFLHLVWWRVDDFYRFASTSFLVSLLNSLFTNAFTLLIGHLYSPRELSFINQASRFSQVIPSNLSMILSRINYSKLVLLRDDSRGFESFLEANLSLLSIVMVFICGVCSLLAGVIVDLMLGDEWHEMKNILSVLFLVMGLIPLNALWMQVIQSLGNSTLYISIEVVKKIVFFGMLLIVSGEPAIYFCYGLGVTSCISLLLHSASGIVFLDLTIARSLLNQTKFILVGFVTYVVTLNFIDTPVLAALIFAGTYLFIIYILFLEDIKFLIPKITRKIP